MWRIGVLSMLIALGPSGALADEAAAPPAPAPIHVMVLGAVRHPGTFTLAAGSRLSDALVAAGVRAPATPASANEIEAMTEAMMERADLQRVFLNRTVDGRRTSYSFDVTRRDSDVRADPLLRDDDHIFVPERRGLRPLIISISWSPFAGAQGDVTTS